MVGSRAEAAAPRAMIMSQISVTRRPISRNRPLSRSVRSISSQRLIDLEPLSTQRRIDEEFDEIAVTALKAHPLLDRGHDDQPPSPLRVTIYGPYSSPLWASVMWRDS